jgi:hypothetical protein
MAKPKTTDKKTYTDDELKEIMLNSLFSGSNFRKVFGTDLENCMRCWELLRTDKKFYKQYGEVINMKLSGMEEEVITGSVFDNLPTKVDKLGNLDLAPGFLKQAEIQLNRAKWLLEKRNENYSSKDIASAMAEGAQVLVMIPKREDDTSEGEK